jgi:hypothetical protein
MSHPRNLQSRPGLGRDPFPVLGSAHGTAWERRRSRDLIAAIAAMIARRWLGHCARCPAWMPPSRAPTRSSLAAARSRSSARRKRFLMMFPSVGPQRKKNAGSCGGKPRERSNRQATTKLRSANCAAHASRYRGTSSASVPPFVGLAAAVVVSGVEARRFRPGIDLLDDRAGVLGFNESVIGTRRHREHLP